MITATEVMSAFATLEYERNRRRPPDEYRLQRFRSGWSDALRPTATFDSMRTMVAAPTKIVSVYWC